MFSRCSYRYNHFNLYLQQISDVWKVQEAYVIVLEAHNG